jgi:hypothetical protein
MRSVLVILLLLLAGCRQVEYIPLEISVRDTLVRENVRIDSVMVTDSVFLHIHTVGDTVFSEKTKVVYRDRFSLKHDTVFISRTDTIKIPTPIEHKATAWERIVDRLEVFVTLLGVIVVCGFLLWFIQLLKK